MNQRSDIFTIRNIFTLILVGMLIIGLYSYHNMNYRLSTSSSTLKSMRMQMEAADSQLKNAMKTKTACFKDVMQLRASTIEMKTKLSDAETELAKEKHEAASKLVKCAEEKKELKSQIEKLQSELQHLKEDDRSKVQKKKEEEEEKEKKLKEMTAEHELIVSKLKDQVADFQKEKTALQKKLDAALAQVHRIGKSREDKPKEEPPKKVEEDTPRQMQPPVMKNPDRKRRRGVESMKQEMVPQPLQSDNAGKEAAAKEGDELKKKLPLSGHRARGGSEYEVKAAAHSKEKRGQQGQQLDMPLPPDAIKQNKEPNQLPKLPIDSKRDQMSDDDDKDGGGGIRVDY